MITLGRSQAWVNREDRFRVWVLYLAVIGSLSLFGEAKAFLNQNPTIPQPPASPGPIISNPGTPSGPSQPTTPQTYTAFYNPKLYNCVKSITKKCAKAASSLPGNAMRLFAPGSSAEVTGFYTKDNVWIAPISSTIPSNAQFQVRAWFSPICTPNGDNLNTYCTADSYQFIYETAQVNWVAGQQRLATKSNTGAPTVMTRDQIRNLNPLNAIPIGALDPSGNAINGQKTALDCKNFGMDFESCNANVCYHFDGSTATVAQLTGGQIFCAPPTTSGSCPASYLGWTSNEYKLNSNSAPMNICY